MGPLVSNAQNVPSIGPHLLNPHPAIRSVHSMQCSGLLRTQRPKFASRLFTRQSDELQITRF